MIKVHIDFETRSTVDLKKAGMYRYAEDDSTEVLCLAYRVGDGPIHLWHMAHPGIEESPRPDDLLELISDKRTVVEAHNAGFERCIWMNWGKTKGWPQIQDHQWRCTAAKSAAHNLPRSLEGVSHALNLKDKKDDEGHRLMLKISKPRKPTKHDQSLWHEKPEELKRLWDYCINDVLVESQVGDRLHDLIPRELEVFRADMRINSRGIACDQALVAKALNVISETVGEMNAELQRVTQGVVTAATQRNQLLEWLQGNGLDIYDTQGTTIDRILDLYRSGQKKVSAVAIRTLEICRRVNRTSTAKYEAMRLQSCEDDRIRGTMMYHGAGTGRWAGRGIQPHNYPRGNIENMVIACDRILNGDKPWLEALYGDVMEFLSWTLRGALIAPPGKDLMAADYSAIEARVTLWHALDELGLDVFRKGKDIYKYTASGIYGTPYKDISKDQRQMGKQAVLGLGFGMGWEKFKTTCESYGIEISDDFAQGVVRTYRNQYHLVKDYWYSCEQAAILAVENPGKAYRVNKVAFGCQNGFLFCLLPSGRRLAYYAPEIRMKKAPWGEMKPSITFMGTDPYTRKWVRMNTYGGKLVENIVQGTARDIMAEAILRIEDTDFYKLIMSVHDELIAEVEEGQGSLTEFENLLTILPSWAQGLPVTAEGWIGKRYKK